jgi:hypothetical protein
VANSNPFNIIVAPYQVYWAPTGTAYPAISATPSGSWILLGTAGAEDYSDAGVTVTHSQTINEIRGASSTGPRKATRTEESIEISLTLMDVTLEQYRMSLNSNAITTTTAASGVTGKKEVNLFQGVDVSVFALLVRGQSPYIGSTNSYMQYQVPLVYQSGNPAPVYNKGVAAMLEVHFRALMDPNAATIADRFGKLVAYTADALP